MSDNKEFDFRKKFTENAKEFDSLMILMLAENKKLKEHNNDWELKVINGTAFLQINGQIYSTTSTEYVSRDDFTDPA